MNRSLGEQDGPFGDDFHQQDDHFLLADQVESRGSLAGSASLWLAAAAHVSFDQVRADRSRRGIVETNIVTKGDSAAPLLIDSSDYPTSLKAQAVEVTIPLLLIGGIAGASFDGVTAGLTINGNLHAPLLCVSDVFKIASGNLSLPGKVESAK